MYFCKIKIKIGRAINIVHSTFCLPMIHWHHTIHYL